MGIAGAGYGAAQSLEEIVTQQLLRQRLEAEIAQREQSFKEQQRSNRADEGMRSRSLDIQDGQLKSAAEERARSQAEGRATALLPLTKPGRIEPEQAQILSGSPITKSLLKVRQTLPETEGVGPLEEPETQRDELPAERQMRTTNERLMETQQQTAADRTADNTRADAAAAEQKRQFGVTSAENRRTHDLMNTDRDAALAARTTNRPATGVQRQTLGFYNRMDSALKDMDAVEDKLNERDVMLINNSPLPDLINNRMLSAAGQQYAQALRTYTEARLRKESGAAIAVHEFENDRKAISRQSGDKPETLTQKRRTRRQTAEGFAFGAGPAYEEFYGEPFQRGAGLGGGNAIDMVDPQGNPLRVPLADIEKAIAAGAKVKP